MSDAPRPDLAAMLGPLGRALIAAEQPVLERHGLTMWGYAVLTGLGAGPVHTQTALARAIGADKTRLIPVLDELQRRGFIVREPDPGDRRVNLVSLTDAGRAARDRAQREIRAAEAEVLAPLSAAERTAFVRALLRLHAARER